MPLESAAERPAGMLENLVKSVNSDRLTRRPTRKRLVSGQIYPEIVKKLVKTSIFDKTRYPANPMGPSGAPSARCGPQSSAKAHVENPLENKGKPRFP